MRKSTENQANFENEAQTKASAQKNRPDNRITSIATLNNETTVEVFKYLKYCGLAKTSLVSKRFCDLIRTHRHRLALLDVKSISMLVNTNLNPTVIEIFDKVLSPEEYNEWVIRNGYSKQIPLETQVAAMEGTQYVPKVYQLRAHADYKDSTPAFERKRLSVIELQKLLSHENWPVFQHFFRLLTDPFVHIRHIGLTSQNDALNLLAGAINPDYGRLQCDLLTVSHEDNMQNFISWIKGYMHCYRIDIMNWSGLNRDDELLDFFMTGANCTSKIVVNFCDPCKTIGALVQKFMDLKDEDKVVGLIECHPNRKVKMKAFNRVYADFVVERSINEIIFEFLNNNIGKKLRLTINFRYRTKEFTLKVANL
ncbi:hypothetical protein Ddc_16522 [Ditylenchus destructor]|nr:hypothetical protein Ddc_16522 [Ditylenchus destructor]